MQHGIRLKPKVKGESVAPEYFIDIDSFRGEMSVDDVGGALESMHEQAFSVFDWCIGEKSREYLSTNKNLKNAKE